MGYQLSNSFRTLTHWQSGKTKTRTEYVERKSLISGLVVDGIPYFMPFTVWDDMSKRVIADEKQNIYGYGFPLPDPSDMAPLISAKQTDTNDKTFHYRAIYLLDEEGQCHWETKSIVNDAPIVINDTYKISPGKEYGICLPVYNTYLFVTGECQKSLSSNMPDWMNSYKSSSITYNSTRDTAPMLKPELFEGLGKVKKGTKIIKMSKTYSGSDIMFGTDKLGNANYCFSGRYDGIYPMIVGAPYDHGIYSFSSGSTVATSKEVGYTRYYEDITIKGQVSKGAIKLTCNPKISYTVPGGSYYMTITREPVKYTLTHGIIWKQKES